MIDQIRISVMDLSDRSQLWISAIDRGDRSKLLVVLIYLNHLIVLQNDNAELSVVLLFGALFVLLLSGHVISNIYLCFSYNIKRRITIIILFYSFGARGEIFRVKVGY